MRLSKDDILKAPGPVTEEVEVPEWGGSVLVRGMTGAERDQFEVRSLRPQDGEMVPDATNVRARVLAWCVVDEDTGERLFTEADAAELGKKAAGPVTRVAEVAMKLSGLAEADVKELEENFAGPPTTAGTAPGGGSSSGSPSASARASRNSSPRSAAAS